MTAGHAWLTGTSLPLLPALGRRAGPSRGYDGSMPLRIAMIAAECEPWAKTGGLGDVVDALSRALGRVPGATDGPVDVFLPRYRSVPVPEGTPAGRVVRVPDPLAPDATTDLRIVDVAANGYRLRLVDHPAAYDREGMYGPPGGGDFRDNAWRFGLLCRAALETLRTEPDRPVDILHLHDWHAGPAAIQRDAWLADDPVIGGAAIVITLHNLAYHGWTGRDQLGQLGLVPGAGVLPADADGVDLIREGIVRAEVANTVSPARRSRPRAGSASPTPSPRRAIGSSGSSTGWTRRSGIRRPTPTSRPGTRRPT